MVEHQWLTLGSIVCGTISEMITDTHTVPTTVTLAAHAHRRLISVLACQRAIFGNLYIRLSVNCSFVQGCLKPRNFRLVKDFRLIFAMQAALYIIGHLVSTQSTL